MVSCIVDPQRVRVLKDGLSGPGPVVYWMSRDQRVHDNWALLYAIEKAIGRHVPLVVLFCLASRFLDATLRQYGFMMRNLQSVAQTLRGNNISFHLLHGDPAEEIPRWFDTFKPAELVTEFDPLHIKKEWKRSVLNATVTPAAEVDTHNIVPCWIASPKQEWGAYTLRPKIRRLLPRFLTDIPPIPHMPSVGAEAPPVDWAGVLAALPVDRSVPEVTWIASGEEHGLRRLHSFLRSDLERYERDRSNPAILSGQSHLSPYLHFGQVSAQRVALEVTKVSLPDESKTAFLEELIVRKELADNFCYYNVHYDGFQGFPEWARRTLDAHRDDQRPFLYSLEDLEQGLTDDDLWNAAQREMVTRGKMHGYMRMYWAKKILEWTESPDQALRFAIYLNDRYELDGRDPNGYTGIAWSIGGVHDRPWRSRPVFGTIRFMSHKGLRSKFDTESYRSMYADCRHDRESDFSGHI